MTGTSPTSPRSQRLEMGKPCNSGVHGKIEAEKREAFLLDFGWCEVHVRELISVL